MENKNVTYGKIIIIGEHSVVYGKPAIAIPFDATSLSVEIEKSEENHINCKFFYGKLEESSEDLLGIKTLIETFIERYKIKDKITISIDSTIPNERGMGSSAAASIGVAKELYKFFNIDHSLDDIMEIANISEKIIHGNPSGIDINVIATNKSIYFVKGKELVSFPIDIDAYLIIADTGKKGKTKEAVSDVKKLVDSDDKYVNYINRLGELTDIAKKCFEENLLIELGEVMNESHELLSKLSVSDILLDTLVNIARESGAIGAKLTGGGRGGCMIAITDTKEKADKIKKNLSKKASNVWITNLKKDKL